VYVSWQGDGGDDDAAYEVNGYGPLGSFGVEMPVEMEGHSTLPTKKEAAAAAAFMLAAKEAHGHVHL
jgi:hypothetical protein